MNPAPPDPDFVLRGKEDPVHSLCYPSGSSVLYSGTQSGQILSWNLETRRVQHSLEAHPGHTVLWLEDTDSDHLLSAGRDGQVCHFSCSGPTWTSLGSLTFGATGFCNAGYIAHKKAVVVSTDEISEVKIIDLQKHKTLASLKPGGKRGMCMHIKVLPDLSDELLVAYEDGSVSAWDLRMSKENSNIGLHSDAVMNFDYDATLQKGCSVSVDNVMKVWKYDGCSLQEISKIEVTNDGFNDIVFRKDSKLFATAGWDGISHLFSAKKHTPLAVLTYHSQAVQTIAFTPENRMCAGSKDGNISIWSVFNK